MRAIGLLGLLAGFALLYSTTMGSYGMLRWDEAEYASIGRSVTRGEGFSISGQPNPLRPPVLPLAVAASILIAGRSDDAVAKRPALLFSILALGVTYWITAAVYGRATGLLAAALLGICPGFWTLTPLVMTEIPFMAFFTAAVACLYLGLYRDPRYLWIAWIAWAVALLTRYTAVLFAPIAVLFVVIAWIGGDSGVRRRVWSREMLLSAVVGVLLVMPWFVREQMTFGNALIGMRQASTELQLFLPGERMPWYFYPVVMPQWLSPAIAVLLLLGINWAVWKRDRLALHSLLAAAVIVVWMSAYRFKETRQITATLPFFAIVAAAGVRQAVLAVAKPRWAAVVAVVLLLAIGGIEFRATLPEFRHTVTLGYPSFLSAMRYLREHTAADAVIAGASVPQIFWYADRRVGDATRAEWIVLTNFERSQTPHENALMHRLETRPPSDDVIVFRDPQFQTLLLRAAASK